MNRNSDVLVVGAGPTGLVLGLWLTLLGVRVRIVDQTSGPGTTSRALAVQARTLELYRQIGLADAVVAGGRKVVAANLWAAGKQVAHAVLGAMGALLLFGVGSTLGMAALSGLMGWPIARVGTHGAVARSLSLTVGCISIMLGLYWGYPLIGRFF